MIPAPGRAMRGNPDMAYQLRIPEASEDRQAIFALLKERGKLEYRRIVELTGIPHKTCMQVIRWMSQENIVKKSRRWSGSQTITSWEIIGEINTEHASIVLAQVELVRAIIESHGVIERSKLDELSGLGKRRVTALLRYMRANDIAYKKQIREYAQGNSVGRTYYAWALEPFEKSPKWKPENKEVFTKRDIEWQRYWSLPREIRRALPEPVIDGL